MIYELICHQLTCLCEIFSRPDPESKLLSFLFSILVCAGEVQQKQLTPRDNRTGASRASGRH